MVTVNRRAGWKKSKDLHTHVTCGAQGNKPVLCEILFSLESTEFAHPGAFFAASLFKSHEAVFLLRKLFINSNALCNCKHGSCGLVEIFWGHR